MRESMWICGVLLVMGGALAACTSPHAPPACVETTCAHACAGTGSPGGSCHADMCVCMSPTGATAIGISSGGVVERRTPHYRVRLAVGPLAQAAHEPGSGHHGELGVVAETVAR